MNSFNSSSRWDLNLTYNVHQSQEVQTIDEDENSYCTPQSDGALLFHLRSPFNLFSSIDGLNYTISSRQLVTNALDPNDVTTYFADSEMYNACRSFIPDITTIYEGDPTLHETTTTTTNEDNNIMMTTTRTETKLSEEEILILDRITASENYDKILLQVSIEK